MHHLQNMNKLLNQKVFLSFSLPGVSYIQVLTFKKLQRVNSIFVNVFFSK